MKILHIIPTYIPSNLASGPIQPMHCLNKQLVSLGEDVTVYTTNFDGQKILDVPMCTEILVDGVKVFYFPLTFKLWSYSKEFHRFLKKNSKNFDVIHISSIFLSFLTLGAYYAKKFNVPYVVTPHGMLMKIPLAIKWFKKKLYLALFEKKNLGNAAAVHFTCISEKNEYLEAGLLCKKAIIVPHGIQLEEITSNFEAGYFRKKFGISPDKKIILFLGRLHWIKGLDMLIVAFVDIAKNNPEAILVIAGPDDGYKNQLEDLIKKHSLTEKVLCVGMLAGKEKNAAFLDSNIFVMPSYSENFNMAIVEAMHAGLPVVATRGVGIWPLIETYGAGIAVEKTSKEVSGAVLKILNDNNLAEKMKAEGQKLVLAEFAPKSVASQMLAEYQNIING